MIVIKRIGDIERLSSATAEIENTIDRLDYVFRAKLWPVDEVLAAKVDVARSILEGVRNDLRDAYVGWDE